MVTMLEIQRLLIIFNFATIIYGKTRHINKDVGESCKFQDHDGACTVFIECKSIYDIVAHNGSAYEEIILCNFIGTSPVICCPDITPNSTLVKAPASSNIKWNNISNESILFEDEFVLIKALSETITNLAASTTGDITDRSKVGSKAANECIKYRAIRITTHIYGGTSAGIGEFPHMAGLGWPLSGSGQNYNFRCGGSLISLNFILTAAHCVYNVTDRPTIVRLGKIAINSNEDQSDAVDVGISEFIIHEQYKPPESYNDIALLRLVKFLDFTNEVRPACLYPKEVDVREDIQLWACGWGQVNIAGQTSEILLKANLTIVPLQTCRDIYSNITIIPRLELPSGIQGNQLCANDKEGGRDTCLGDSGGPLQIMDDPEQTDIYGIVSFGYGCNTSSPGVYARVGHYIEWIEKHVWP